MKKISSRQIMIFYCIYTFSIKFLMLPQLLAKTAGPDAWISALIGTVLELVILFLVLTVITMNQNSDIYSDLRKKTKWFGANIVILGMLAIFLLQIFVLISQGFYLLNGNIFDHIPINLFCLPMLAIGIFFCFMPARAIFRSGEIFFIFIFFGIALSVFPALGQIKPKEVLPIFDNGFKPIVNAFYQNMIYFESAFFLLMFSGDIKVEKHFKKKFMTLATLAGVFFVFFIFMFYALFGPLSPMKDLAISNMTLYSSGPAGGGRLDWILVTMWLLLLLIRFGITFYCAFACLRYLTHVKHRAGYLSFGLAVVVYLLSVFVFATSRELNRFITTIPWLIATLILVIPLVSFICALFTKRSGTAQVKQGATKRRGKNV